MEAAKINVQIKWGKEKFNLEVDTQGTVEDFRAQIYSKTTVPIQKQKVMYKGKQIKEETNLSTCGLTENCIMMLMGTAEGTPSLLEKEVKTVFLEDLSPKSRAKILREKTGIILPSGLANLGNTCYLNSSIQCLKRVDELKQFLQRYQASNNFNVNSQITGAIKQLFIQLETAGESFQPMQFVQTFMNCFPQFAERTKQGVFQQQDADECFQNLVQCLEAETNTKNEEGETFNLINQLFKICELNYNIQKKNYLIQNKSHIQFEIKFQNIDLPEEPIEFKTESSRKLMCIIDNQSNPVNQLTEGIAASLQDSVEKNSSVDNQNHIYNKLSRIKTLPSYLAVQMVRFFWKQAISNTNTQATKAKILKNVAFPKILDVYNFCTEDLQKQLDLGRDYEKKQAEEKLKSNDDKIEAYKKKLEAEGKMIPEDTKQIYKQFKEEEKEQDLKDHDEQLYRKHGTGLDAGNYQLVAVLTHQGRSADSGHYMSWVHQSGDQWVKYDDDKVTEVKLEDVLNLRGGGDWHMAYYLIYRKIEIV